MNQQVATRNGQAGQIAPGGKNPQDMAARNFRRTASSIARSVLTDWVGEERAKEATGRLASALAAAAAAARDPADFYACTPQSVGTCIAQAALTGIMPGVGSTALAYVIPQRARRGEPPQLEYRLSHRGVNALARRCGQTMIALPISHADEIDVNDDGEVTVIKRDIDNPPMTHEELRGVLLIVKELSSGATLTRGWVPKKLIEQRRSMSMSWQGKGREYSPWTRWPVEQAQKTAMHYAIGRGWCVIDDTSAAKVLAADAQADTIVLSPDEYKATRKSKADQVAALLADDDDDPGEFPEVVDAPEPSEDSVPQPEDGAAVDDAEFTPPPDGESEWVTQQVSAIKSAVDLDEVSFLEEQAAERADLLSQSQKAAITRAANQRRKELNGGGEELF